jgi:hypothetical protein
MTDKEINLLTGEGEGEEAGEEPNNTFRILE